MNARDADALTEAEFAQIVETHSGKLTSYVYHRTRQLELSRDIVQEAFLRLLKARRKPSGDHVIPWLYLVCRNLAVDSQRRQSRWVDNGSDLIQHFSSSSEPDPLQSTIESETRQLLYLCLDQLPERHREVMVLKFQSGLSYKSISAVTGLSVTNVGFVIHQSVSRLRYEMAKRV